MIREYKESDFLVCVEIVNDVWNFDNKFKPRELSEFFKKIYTGGSLAASNYNVVVVEDGIVKGFLFGKCGKNPVHKNEYSGILGGLKSLLQLFSVKGVSLRKKIYFLKYLIVHEKERVKIEPTRDNEVHLFAVETNTQGKGYGKLMMNSFINFCKKQNVTRITLDTDKECNVGFYEHFGFKVKGKFFSPVQMEYSEKSGDTYVYELKF